MFLIKFIIIYKISFQRSHLTFIFISTLESCNFSIEWRIHHPDARADAVVVFLPNTLSKTPLNEVRGQAVCTVASLFVGQVRVVFEQLIVIHSAVVRLQVNGDLRHQARSLVTRLAYPRAVVVAYVVFGCLFLLDHRSGTPGFNLVRRIVMFFVGSVVASGVNPYFFLTPVSPGISPWLSCIYTARTVL